MKLKESYVTEYVRKCSSVQPLSRVRLFATPWAAARARPPCPSPTPGACSSIQSVMPSNHLILCPPLLLPSIFPSIRVVANDSVLPIRWPKYWSFSFSISPSNEYSGLIFFRMDWLDLLAVQGTLKSLLQHHSSKVSIFPRSAFFTVQLSYPYVTPGKTTALSSRTFIGKVMSLLFNMLSRLVINLFTINLEALLPVLHSWRSLETIGRIKLKFRGRRVKPQTCENHTTPDYTEHQGIRGQNQPPPKSQEAPEQDIPCKFFSNTGT